MGDMKQCNLRKGNSHTTVWIPEHGAIVGNIVELKTFKESGWEVIAVGESMDEKDLYEHAKMHQVHRHGSDA